jgi:hypothetical protein
MKYLPQKELLPIWRVGNITLKPIGLTSMVVGLTTRVTWMTSIWNQAMLILRWLPNPVNEVMMWRKRRMTIRRTCKDKKVIPRTQRIKHDKIIFSMFSLGFRLSLLSFVLVLFFFCEMRVMLWNNVLCYVRVMTMLYACLISLDLFYDNALLYFVWHAYIELIYFNQGIINICILILLYFLYATSALIEGEHWSRGSFICLMIYLFVCFQKRKKIDDLKFFNRSCI